MDATRDEVIRLAREAGTEVQATSLLVPFLERFAALVAAAEREACAKTCEARSLRDDDMGAILARTIRAKNKT